MNSDPLVGKIIDGRYEIQQHIGEGGMGVVYRARQISIDRVIAIKMLNAQMAADPNWVQRFYNEAKACSRLQHPNTIRMFDFGQTQEGRLFMTMEFLDGMSLRQALDQGALAPQRVIKVMIQCCASLAEAHSIGIIHRDIKPDNVFLLNMAGSPDFVKLLDFSVAKLLEGDRMKTQAGVVFGTPQYMSPEQGRGVPLDARSDLYALGVLAFEMLTGNVPFNDENPMTVIQMHLNAAIPPMPASVPYSVQQLVRRALEKDPARRYQSAGEMMQHAQQIFAELNGGGVSIGAGGVPRTIVAPMPGISAPPMQQQQQPQQAQPQSGLANQGPGYQASAAGAKTMIAGISPFAANAPGGPMQQMQAPPQAQQPPYQNTGAQQKTIVAGMAPQIPNGQMMGMQAGMQSPGMQPPGMQPPGMGMPGMQPPGGGPSGGFNQPPSSGPNKTVMLQPSDGVISVARTPNQAVAPAGAVGTSGPSVQQGASTLFWIMSMLIGIGLGALAYVIVLQLQ